jgi:hypothetical protein
MVPKKGAKIGGIWAFLRAKQGDRKARMGRAKKVKAGSERAPKLRSQRHDGRGFQGEGSQSVVSALPATLYRPESYPSPPKRGPIFLLDIPREMPYSGSIGTDPALKSPRTHLTPQRFSSPKFWRRLRAAGTLR